MHHESSGQWTWKAHLFVRLVIRPDNILALPFTSVTLQWCFFSAIVPFTALSWNNRLVQASSPSLVKMLICKLRPQKLTYYIYFGCGVLKNTWCMEIVDNLWVFHFHNFKTFWDGLWYFIVGIFLTLYVLSTWSCLDLFICSTTCALDGVGTWVASPTPLSTASNSLFSLELMVAKHSSLMEPFSSCLPHGWQLRTNSVNSKQIFETHFMVMYPVMYWLGISLTNFFHTGKGG